MRSKMAAANRVLFVDDETHVLKALTRLFMDEPYEVIIFDNPIEALKKMQQNEIGVVVSDQRMPQMTGTVFLEKVRDRWPDTVRIILTGYADLNAAVTAINQGNVYRFISKPWDDTELKLAVRDAVAHYELICQNKRLLELTRKQNEELRELNQALRTKVEIRTKELKHNEKRLEQTIQAVALTLEIRDAYTAGHQRRVANLARAIGTEMGISGHQIDAIRMAGTVHDIGKISVPAEILSKPGRLPEIEFNLIKTHPKVGYDILKEIEFLWPVAQIVLQHHERVDGSGYPQGLSGEDILVEARILGVADIVEAMASHRPYRPSLGMEKAMEEISKGRGILYDPEVVDVCLKLFKEEGFQL